MITIITKPLKLARTLYLIFKPESAAFGRNERIYPSKDYANDLIYKYLKSDKPCMIARFGGFELNSLVNYLGVNNKNKSIIKYIKGQQPEMWWNKSTLKYLHTNAGFFPNDIRYVEKFCEQMLNDIPEIDVLGSWLKEERFVFKELINTKRVVLEDLEPFFSINPWTKALEGKKVLIIHPFTETIEKQYEKRNLLFENNLLPKFELITLKAVQSIAGEKTEFNNWFEALDSMKAKIDAIDYDICIIGAGAYGFPLAAHVKRRGKKGFHLGGVTQLLFGIKGRRWVDNPILYYPYVNLFNDHWTYPLQVNKPMRAKKVEDACYW